MSELSESDAMAGFTAITQNSFNVLLHYLDDQRDYLQSMLAESTMLSNERDFHVGALAHNRAIRADLEQIYAKAQAGGA
jgi:hypothetical protein